MSESTAHEGDRLVHGDGSGSDPEPGGETDTGNSVLPPYDDRTTESTNSRDMEAMAHSRGVTHEQSAASGRSTSDEDNQSSSDLPPAGVGESTSRRGEDMADEDGKEAGRRDEGTEGGSDRPYGSSDDRDRTGI